MSTQPIFPVGRLPAMPLTPVGLRPGQPKIDVGEYPHHQIKTAQSVESRPYLRLNLIGEPNTIAYLDTETCKILRAKIGPRAEFYMSDYYDPA